MPTYTYECRKCHHTLEVFHPMTANPRVKCPVCGGGCKRLLGTGAALIFKGSGFYETDYKKSGKPSGDSAKTGEAKTDAAAGAKTEAKTESRGPKSDATTKAAKKD